MEFVHPIIPGILDTNLLRTRGNSAANQRSHIVPGESDVQASLIVIIILADLI